jgi:hypothetical protein
MNRFIVAEISKNWVDGEPFLPETQLIANQFELVIQRNLERGYKLHSFVLQRLLVSPTEMNETIVAVFEKETP